ncbi:MAG: pseudouridine synthase [Lachnospiraceae bacterium]|nr:pseudouridine synthase [Lachnospiraceae bacterium]
MVRLDKYLCDAGVGTRSRVKELIRNGQVRVDGFVCKRPEEKVDENKVKIDCNGQNIVYKEHTYLMFYKPQGIVSATEDKREETVIDFLKKVWNEEKDGSFKDGIFPVGRLDKDTEGLLLLTDDGALAHELLSPKKHVVKTYEVTVEKPLHAEAVLRLECGLDIGDEKPTMPARARVQEDGKLHLSITEGRFHQVKRMLAAVGNRVLHLKRLRMGTLYLDEELRPGGYRPLTEREIQSLRDKVPSLKDIEAVIFDVDGTMADSMWVWKKIDREYLSKFDITLPDMLQAEIEGRSFYETAVYFKEHFGLADSLEKIMADWNDMAREKYEKEVPLKSGVRDFMELCKDKGIKMGIATSNSRELFEIVERVHGLTEYISSIRTGSEVPRGKPAPDIYLAVAKQLQTDPAKCLVFEDLPAGIMAGRNAGMKVCAVQDAYSLDYDQEKRELADYYIEEFGQVAEREKLRR